MQLAPIVIPPKMTPPTKGRRVTRHGTILGEKADTVFAMIPHIESDFGLDVDGNFTAFDFSASTFARQSSQRHTRTTMHDVESEDLVADQRQKTTFAEIDGREIRAVFQLGPVRRAVRHLPHSAILMREDVCR